MSDAIKSDTAAALACPACGNEGKKVKLVMTVMRMRNDQLNRVEKS